MYLPDHALCKHQSDSIKVAHQALCCGPEHAAGWHRIAETWSMMNEWQDHLAAAQGWVQHLVPGWLLAAAAPCAAHSGA